MCVALNEIAKRRGQSLAQLALAWTLRDPRVNQCADRREPAGADHRERRGVEELELQLLKNWRRLIGLRRKAG